MAKSEKEYDIDDDDPDYEADLKIDSRNLDDEWKHQPQLFGKYARLAAQAKKKADLAKERVELVKARLDTEIRHSKESGKKITEGAITAEIIQHTDYRKAVKNYIHTKYIAELLIGAVRSFDQRKSALENMVKLYGMEYYSDPKEPDFNTIKRYHTNRTEKANERVKINPRRRRDEDG